MKKTTPGKQSGKKAAAYIPPKSYLCTDIGNAERLIDRYHHRLRYNWHTKQWYVWDGRRWSTDEGGVHRMAKEVAKDIIKEKAKDEDAEKRISKWFVESQSVRAINAMIDLARSDARIQVKLEEFDADPDFLNCQNGVLHLPSGKLHDHNPCYMLTKMVPCNYTPGARDAKFDALLEHVGQGDAELSAFIRRAFGYSISGSNTEEVSFFAHGPTQTGKSTLLEAIGATLGDKPDGYAKAIDSETLMAVAYGRSGGPRDDIARLSDARFVYAVETEEDRKLAVALFKKLFGGDQITARAMYGKTFQFLPGFNMWLAFNDPPQVNAADAAMWRRILQVPFDKQVPEGNRDKSLKTYFRNPKHAGSAILAWLVEGYQDWRRHGLNPPDRVLAATEAYRVSQDSFALWLADSAVLEPTGWTDSDALVLDYEQWFHQGGSGKLITRKTFYAELRKRGCETEQERVAPRRRGWRGITLKVNEQMPLGDFQIDVDEDVTGTAGTAGTANC